jgi:hypothetical protein
MTLVDELLRSDEPAIRWKVRARVKGEDPASPAMRRLAGQVRSSATVQALLSGLARLAPHTYAKWQGGHWVLQALADLGYPAGDKAIVPIRDSVQATWLQPRFFQETLSRSPKQVHVAVPLIDGRYRRCGSQQGGALLAVVRLGLANDGSATLAERLRHWQWPDGGWNCDRDPAAATSSVYETLLPMRGLHAFGIATGDQASVVAARAAAEVLLSRRLLFRRSNGQLIRPEWVKLHYPLYWHYDVLGALKGLAELGQLADPRAQEGLDLLQSKELPSGGWPAEATYYRRSAELGANVDFVSWGGISARRRNDWVTADALAVLTAAGRL